MTGQSLRGTQAFWFLNTQYILRPRLGSECPEGCVRPQLLSSTGLCAMPCCSQLVLSLLPSCGSRRDSQAGCYCCHAIVPPSWIRTCCTCEPSINWLFSKLPWLRCLIMVVEKWDSALRVPVIPECVLMTSPACGLAVGVACPLRQKHRPGRSVLRRAFCTVVWERRLSRGGAALEVKVLEGCLA